MKNTLFPKLAGLYKYIPALFLIVSVPAVAQVQQSTPSGEEYNLTLKQTIDYALQNQYQVVNGKINESIAGQKIRESTSSYLPQLNGNAELDDYFAKPVSIIPGSFFTAFSGHPSPDVAVSFLLQYQATAGLSASQAIFNASYLTALKAAKTYAGLSKDQTKQIEIEEVAAVTKLYYKTVIDQKNLNALDSTISISQKNLDDAKAMYAQGFKEKLDVDRLTVALSAQQVQRQSKRGDLDVDYFTIKYTMGMPVNASLTLTDNLPDSFPAPVTETSDYTKRIEYAVNQIRLDLDIFTVKANKAGYIPTLSAFGSISANAYRSEFNIFDTKQQWYPTGVIGLKLNVPIFDGFQKAAKIKEANFTAMQDQNKINDLKNSIALDVKKSSVSYESSYKNLVREKESLKLAQDVAHVSKTKYEEGVGSNLEVTTDENGLLQEQMNYYTALLGVASAWVDLQKAKGTLY